MDEKPKPAAGLILAALLGSGSGLGGTMFYLKSISAQDLEEIARPDPATGTQLKGLQREIDYHLANHPDVMNQFERRISRMEAQFEILIERRISKMEAQLEALGDSTP